MTIVVPQGGADAYLTKKYKSKDTHTHTHSQRVVFNLKVSRRKLLRGAFHLLQDELMDFATWIDKSFPASGRRDALYFQVTCMYLSNVQDRVQS